MAQPAAQPVGKENIAIHSKGATPLEHPNQSTTLLVPAAAWHALHMRIDDLQAQNITLAKEQTECSRYLKAFLKMEHHRRERASTRLQAAARGMLSRRRHAHALEKHRWSLRFTTLESALQQERRARKAQEAALRKLWADVAALTQALASVAPTREAPGADG